MRRVLIISPYFPPLNAADMQRIRMSLPYFKDFGWEPHVVTIDPKYCDVTKDDLLEQSIPKDIPVTFVKALPKKWTAKVGLGNIALRSLPHYRNKVNRILKANKFDLIYFSTTQTVVCTLGAYWKKRFNIPFVIDMQDPWFSDYYKNKPKHEQPPKYWFSYRLSRWTEPIAMRQVDGLISVSDAYLRTLSLRYQNCRNVPQKTITFGAFNEDLEIANRNKSNQASMLASFTDKINIVYVGRGGFDMRHAVSKLFAAFKSCITESPELFKNFHFHFIGTSYAASGQGSSFFLPLVHQFGLQSFVTEVTDRIPFYQSLNTLRDANALFIPGSSDPQYTASKIYSYAMVKKPLLALFNPESSVVTFLKESRSGIVITFDQPDDQIKDGIKDFLYKIAKNEPLQAEPVAEILESYSARTMTRKQCDLFNEVVK